VPRALWTSHQTARGIDARHVDLVVNAEMPRDVDTYFHRIGRAGRFGRMGSAVTLTVDSLDAVKYMTIAQIGEPPRHVAPMLVRCRQSERAPPPRRAAR